MAVLTSMGQVTSEFPISIQTARSDFGNRSARVLQKYCKDVFSDKFGTAKSPLIKLSPRIKTLNGSMIEGMETVTSSEVELQLLVSNVLTKEKVSWKWPFKVSGEQVNKIVLDSITMFFEADTKVGQSMKDFVDDYISSEFGKNCAKYLEEARSNMENEDFQRVIQIASSIPSNTPCSSEAEILVSKAYDQYQSQLCGKNLYEAQLEAAAGRYERAVQRLYCIAYDAPCAEEALKIAKQITETGKSKLKANSQNNLSTMVLYLDRSGSQAADRSSWYRKQISILRLQ